MSKHMIVAALALAGCALTMKAATPAYARMVDDEVGTVCADGTGGKCFEQTIKECVEWRLVTVGGNVSVGGGGGATVTQVCSREITTVVTKYWAPVGGAGGEPEHKRSRPKTT